MHRGIVTSAWEPYAGRVPLILQSSVLRPDDSVSSQIADPEDAVRLGADAIAVVALLRGATEGRYLKNVADYVKAAERFEIPVIVHAYPRDFSDGVQISYRPEDIAWAVRSVMECGAEVIKVPFCGDVAAHAQIVAECTVPVVAAGGPKTKTLGEALRMLADVVRSGAAGATVGRNVWSHPDVAAVVRAVKAVIHDAQTPDEALRLAGLV
jgi:class I fructose-bisphosphate aldolase